MKGSCVDLSSKTELGWLADLLGDVESVIPGYEILVVGAMARDLLLHYASGLPITRASRDIDLAVAVPDWSSYDSVRSAFLDTATFQSHGSIEHRLTHASGIPIDLIPFGTITGGDDSIVWPRDGNTMAVVGFREAYDSALTVYLPNRRVIRVVSLPMLVALKLCAWRDRRQARPNVDAQDLFLLLRQYEAVCGSDRLYEDHADLLGRDGFDQETAFVEILGHDCRGTVEAHSPDPEALLRTLDSVLAPEVDSSGPLRLVTEGAGPQAERMLRLLVAFRRGLRGE